MKAKKMKNGPVWRRLTAGLAALTFLISPCAALAAARAGEESAESSSIRSTSVQSSTPAAASAPVIPEIAGYQGGRANGKTYYAKTFGASMLFYQTKPSGGLTRVIAPTVKDKAGRQYCPVNHSGTVLFPRVTQGVLTAHCEYRDGQEIPVLHVQSLPQAAGEDMQTLSLNGKTYHVRLSGSCMLFYQAKPSGGLTQVIGPYARDKAGNQYYPANCGGTVLIPQLQLGSLAAYSYGGDTVLTTQPAGSVPEPTAAVTQKPTPAPTAASSAAPKRTLILIVRLVQRQ